MTDPWAPRPTPDAAPTTPSLPSTETYGAPAQAPAAYWTPPAPDAPDPSSPSNYPAATAIQPVTPTRKRGGATRWIVALVATAIFLVAGLGVAVFAAGARTSASVGPTFLPASTLLYAEGRLDLPGDQRDNVVTFLGHFPGFADPSTFDTKIDDVFDNWLSNATDHKISYTADVKPWFGGQAALGLTGVPTGLMGPSTGDGDGKPLPPVIGGLSVKDVTKLQATLTTLRGGSQASFSEESYGGSTVVTVTKDGKPSGAYAATDKLLLFALDAAGVKTALDVLDGSKPSLASDADFKKAVEKLPADRLGAMYVDGVQLRDALKSAVGSALDGTGQSAGISMLMDPAAAFDALPDQMAGALVANTDNLALDLHATAGPKTPSWPSRTTDLAASFPSGTAVYVEVRDVGTSVHDLLAGLKTQFGEMLGSTLDQAEAALGTKVEDFFDFVQDVGIGGSYANDKLSLGLAATVTDEQVAKDRVGRLLTTLRLATVTGQVPIKVTETTVDGVTVTTIAATEGAGLPADLPIDASVSVAVGKGKLFIGSGDFAAQALQRTAADSLAGDARYSSALAAAGGSPNTNVVYADIAGLRDAIVRLAPSSDDFTSNTLPYLEPLDRFVEVGTTGSDQTLEAKLLLFVH